MGSLLEEFNVNIKTSDYETNDYNVFEDKNLMDGFRIQILELLSDKGFTGKNVPKSVINDQIDEVCYGYDLSNGERSCLFNLIDGEVNGFGPITYLMKDDNITEIMVNSPSEVYIEIDGTLRRETTISFVNDEHIIRTIERLVEPTGKVIDVNHPMIDARLDDGSRINAVIPPLSKYPIITIRKFRKNIVDIENLIWSRIKVKREDVGKYSYEDFRYRIEIINKFYKMKISRSEIEKKQLLTKYSKNIFSDYTKEFLSDSYLYYLEDNMIRYYKLFIFKDIMGEIYYFLETEQGFLEYSKENLIEKILDSGLVLQKEEIIKGIDEEILRKFLIKT